MTLKVLVVDDEAPARRRLARQVATLGHEVVAEAADGEAALAAIAAHAPDVMLLDIRMPGIDGLTLAQRTTSLPPIIFCTAWSEFAVQAFEVNAVDYLLKPVRVERLGAALGKVSGPGSKAMARALEVVAPVSPTRLITGERGAVRFFDARDVTRFWASDKYTVFRADGGEHLIEESLVTLSERLAPFGFVQVHRAELVRLDAVRSLRSDDGVHELELQDGQVARVSRRELGTVRKALGLSAASS
jgi:DNA-binding LytR/AlgR family response regulator